MRTGRGLSWLLLLLFVAPNVAGSPANDRDRSWLEPRVQLVQIGTRSYPDGSRVPIWAVMMGDTARAERIARRYNRFGPYSLNATIWARSSASPAWVRTTYRRPQSLDEIAAWYEDAEAFSFREEGGTWLLPEPFARLSSELMRRLDFIIRYDDESAKAYLYPGTSRQDAEGIVAAIDTLLD